MRTLTRGKSWCWENILRPERPVVSVMHVANDPVNFGVGEVSYTELGDRISFFSDVLLSYRYPLQVKMFLRHFCERRISE